MFFFVFIIGIVLLFLYSRNFKEKLSLIQISELSKIKRTLDFVDAIEVYLGVYDEEEKG